MPKVSRSALLNYRRALHRCAYIFECEQCKGAFSAWDYTQHVYRVHDIAMNFTCPWYKCKIEGMTKNAHHLRLCFERFLNASILKIPTVAPNLSDQAINPPERQNLPICSCATFNSESLSRKMMGRSHLPVSFHFYESFCETSYLSSDWFNPSACSTNTSEHMLAIQSNQLVFSKESGLGADAPMFVRKFFELAETTAWYHVIVRAAAFQQFYDAIQAEKDHLGLLPYWCLCDGLSNFQNREPNFVHHRHMILISSDNGAAFRRAWSRVKPTERSFKHEPCKIYKRIITPIHLVNVLQYVSTPQSNCGEMGPTKTRARGGTHHYFIARHLSEHANRNLSQMWPGGLQSYFQKKLGSFHVDAWWEVAKLKSNKWTVPISTVCPSINHCIVPYNHDFEPAYTVPLSQVDTKSAEGYLFLLDDLVMVLKRNSNLPGGSEWFDYQMNHGNCMNEAIKDYCYILTKLQQRSMNQVKNARLPLERQIDDLKIQLQTVQAKLDAQTSRWELTQGSVQQALLYKEALNSKLNELQEHAEKEIRGLKLLLARSMDDKNEQIKQIEQTVHEKMLAAESTLETQAQLQETNNQIDCKIEELKQSVEQKLGEIEKLQIQLTPV